MTRTTIDRIQEARAEFMKRHQGDAPDVLYLGRDDYHEFQRDALKVTYCPPDTFITFMGLQIHEVAEDRHFAMFRRTRL